MPDTPRFGIRFKYRPTDAYLAMPSRTSRSALGGPARYDRARVYALALVFAARAATVVDRAAAERYFLRDQLDRKSSILPQLIAQGLALADMVGRRALYERARQIVIDCAAILDLLFERGTVELEPLVSARALSLALLDELVALTAPPPRIW